MTKFTKPSEEMLQSFVGKNILDIAQFSKEELEAIVNTAGYYEEALIAKKRLYDMDGKILASLFFEPSTRTRLSFECAMERLGGKVITVSESTSNQTSSTAKGETMYDSIMVVNDYCDVIACRNPYKDSRFEIARAAKVPYINGGDGAAQHPTQALLDMYTIFKEKGAPDGMTVALVGDLKHGRTVHSLSDALLHYDVKYLMVSPKGLEMPADIVQKLRDQGKEVEETHDFDYGVSHADVIYMTRVQRERFEDKDEYERVKDEFILAGRHVPNFKKGAIILHPLPRVNEITVEVDDYAGASYFRQAGNGVPTRMALLALVTGSVK